MPPLDVTAASANASGITAIHLTTTTPLTGLVMGIPGQPVDVTGVAGSMIAQGGNITTCTGLPDPTSTFPIRLTEVGTFGFNQWKESCSGVTPNAPAGINLTTTSTQPSCTSAYRGKLWTVQGNGTSTPDQLQQCQLTASGSYVWHSF